MVLRVSHFIAILFFCFYLIPKVVPIRAFDENFDNIDSSMWNINQNGGNLSVNGGVLSVSSSDPYTFPYLFTKTSPFPIGNFKMEIRFSFPVISGYGYGIAISKEFPINQQNFPVAWQPATILIWNAGNGKFLIATSLCNFDDLLCDVDGEKLTIIDKLPEGEFHTMVVELNDKTYKIFIDSNLSFTSKPMDTVVNGIWFGEPERIVTPQLWGSLQIDRISVSGINQYRDNISTLILPGFGGSWDVGAILEGREGSNWKIPEFVREYDGIINSFKNAGYVEGENLFVFPYDWRKSLTNLASDLNKFVIDNGLSDKEINLVGHSLGGLVARTYLQNYNNPKVNKVIMVGSPNKGIADAYELWEGASAGDGVWWQKVLLEIASEVNRKEGETKIDAIRRIAPSVKDLMPTENFLIKNSVSKPWNTLVYKNDFLADKNSNLLTFLPKLFAGGSVDNHQTKSAINVEDPNTKESFQGLWVDGKPTKTNTYLFSNGDGYVNKNSSLSLFDNQLDLSGGHGDTISKKENIVKILSELNVATTSAVGSESETHKRAFVAKLNSPGKLHVCFATICDSDLGIIFGAEKLFIAPNYNDEKYSITVSANGETGNYGLLIGEVNGLGEWKNIEGKLTSTNQSDNYFYDGTTNQLTADTKSLENIMKVFWTKKIKPDELNDLRENLLEDMDKNIKRNNIANFDLDISKWKTLDLYASTKEDSDRESKHFEKSKYLGKISNYFASTLAQLLSETEQSLNLLPWWKHKLREDKQIQIRALSKFLGI